MADVDFGILIRAIDQASGTLKSVQGELDRLHRTSQTAAIRTTALTQAQQQLSQTLSAVNRTVAAQVPALGQLTSTMEGISVASAGVGGIFAGIAVAAVAVAGASVTAAKAIGNYQERMDLAAAATGLTHGQIGALTVAASNVGKNFQDIQPSLSIFTRRLGEAKEGSAEAVKAFSSLRDEQGLAINIGKESSEVFDDVAKAINNVRDPAERMRIVFELFGRSGQAMLGILAQDLTEAERVALKLGIVLSPAAQQIARDADVASDRVKLSFTGMMNSITVVLAPLGTMLLNAINGFITSIRGLGVVADDVKADKLVAQLDMMGDAAEKNAEKIKEARSELESMALSGREAGFAVPSLPGLGRAVAATPSAVLPGLVLPEGVALAEKLTKAQLDQLTATRAQIALLGDRVRWGVITGEKEIDILATMRSQVASRQELLAIEQAIAGVRIEPKEQGIPGLVGISGIPIFGVGKPDIDPIKEARDEWQAMISEAQSGSERLRDSVGLLDLSLNNASNSAQRLMANMGNIVANTIGSTVSNVIRGVTSIGDALKQLVLDVLAQIAASAVATGIKSLFGLPFQTGGTLLQPVQAQAGLIVSGIRGRDTVPALLGRGETVVSHTMTERWDRTLSALASLIADQRQAAPVAATMAAPSITVPVTVNLNTSFIDRKGLVAFAQEELAGIIVDTINRGGYRAR